MVNVLATEVNVLTKESRTNVLTKESRTNVLACSGSMLSHDILITSQQSYKIAGLRKSY